MAVLAAGVSKHHPLSTVLGPTLRPRPPLPCPSKTEYLKKGSGCRSCRSSSSTFTRNTGAKCYLPNSASAASTTCSAPPPPGLHFWLYSFGIYLPS